MGSSAGHGRPDTEPDLEAGHRARRSRPIGLLLILGAVAYGTNALLFDRVVFPVAFGGPPRLYTLVSDPLWVVYRTAGMVSVLAIAVGLVYLLDRLDARDHWGLQVTTLGTLGASVVLFLVEFGIAAQATTNVMRGMGGIGITRNEVELILMAYQGIGVAVLMLAILFLGLSLALTGVLLARTDAHVSELATSGIVAGLAVALFGVAAFFGVVDFRFPEPYSQVVAGAWLLALGVAERRRTSRRDEG